MKNFKNLLIIFLASTCIFNTVVYGEKLKAGSFPIPLMVVDSNNGVFIELFKEISKRAAIECEISIAPAKRTVVNFLDGNLDIFFPALDVIFPPGKSYLKSKELIYIKKDFVFTKKGSPLLKLMKDLKGKKIGITRGYPYVMELIQNKSLTLEYANSDEMNTKKLMAGRIDAFIVEEKSGLQAFKNTSLISQIQYDSKTPFSSQDVYFAFKKNDKGIAGEKKFSKALADMKKDGTFKGIMSKAK